MRLGEGVEWGLHCTTLLALLPDGSALPAGRLAEFHGVPPAYLAKVMQALARDGIVDATPGRSGGYRLAKPASQISLLAVVEAIEGSGPSFLCTEIRQRGPARLAGRLYSPMCAIAAAMHEADQVWRDHLTAITIADLLSRLASTIPEQAAAKGADWLRAVLS